MIEMGTSENFKNFLSKLCLTDRQKSIAIYKYLRGWASVDIAAELDISRRTVTTELSVIRKVIGSAQLKLMDKRDQKC